MHKPIRNGLFYFPIGSQCGLITKLREIFVNLSQFLVPEIGLEPIRMLLLRILSPVRLPIPPFGHIYSYFV